MLYIKAKSLHTERKYKKTSLPASYFIFILTTLKQKAPFYFLDAVQPS